MKNGLRVLGLILLAISFLEISGCGKMSENAPIEGSDYPHKYPRH